MSPRRRRLRDETVAPWLTMIVVIGLWCAGAWVVQSSRGPVAGTPPEAIAIPRGTPPSEMLPSPEEAILPAPPRDALADDVAPALRNSEPAPAPGADSLPSERAMVPVAGVDASSLQSTFNEARGGGNRRHEAMDILAPRGTPVVAAVDGRVVKLFTSAAGGLTIYQFDVDERFCYYYAHLDSYASDLNEGQIVKRGQIIGYVGTTGNAPPDTPHLHFAVYRLGNDKKWWEGQPLDPIDILR